jgi:hypothetical protein
MWMPHDLHNPYIQEVIKHERIGNEGVLEFNGYFYIEDGSCPVERIMSYDESSENGFVDSFHIEIYEKCTGRDTSYDGYEGNEDTGGDEDDEFGGRICFFPTAIICLKYRVLEKIKGFDEMTCIHENIVEQQEEFRKREVRLRAERVEREMKEAAEIGSKIDYKAWFAKIEEKRKEKEASGITYNEEDDVF